MKPRILVLGAVLVATVATAPVITTSPAAAVATTPTPVMVVATPNLPTGVCRLFPRWCAKAPAPVTAPLPTR